MESTTVQPNSLPHSAVRRKRLPPNINLRIPQFGQSEAYFAEVVATSTNESTVPQKFNIGPQHALSEHLQNSMNPDRSTHNGFSSNTAHPPPTPISANFGTPDSRQASPSSQQVDDDGSWQTIEVDGQVTSLPRDLSSLDPELKKAILELSRFYKTDSPIEGNTGSQELTSVPDVPIRARNSITLSESTMTEKDDADLYCCIQSQKMRARDLPGISYCETCEIIYCDTCWDGERLHKIKNQRHKHNKIDIAVAKWIHDALEVNCSGDQQAYNHLLDEGALWFGAGMDPECNPVFRDHGRFDAIMSETAGTNREKRTPALVAFVGGTGAGKSSLIKLLVSLYDRKADHRTPVVGANSNEDTPTSGDVHLYSDPLTALSSEPILYADCEGLTGGTREPVGAKYRKRRTSLLAARQEQTPSLRQYLRKAHDSSERDILWANTSHRRTRKYFVRELYPRLLYTFSDVIVFVVQNVREIEDVVEQLLTWADAVREASSNQPNLPHAIIVLNASKNRDEELWDVNKATQVLIGSVQEALRTNPKLKKYADFWRSRGVSLDNIEALLLSYYASVRVVRVPEKSQQTLVHVQIRALYKEIAEATKQSLNYKAGIRMKMTAEELQPYLQKAFDHFCRTLEAPFDFVKAAHARCSIPSDFSGNILKLAIAIMERWHNQLDGPLVFKELSFMLASSAMLDAVRRGIPGMADSLLLTYEEHFSEALEEFCERHWPCEYVCDEGRCVNVSIGHRKGHQLASAKVVDPSGVYQTTFNAYNYRQKFLTDIFHALEDLLDNMKRLCTTEDLSEMDATVKLHQSLVLKNFYRHIGGAANFISHSSCLVCLVHAPEHCLPCGHVLCTPCVEAFGQTYGSLTVQLTACPLHHENEIRPPWTITLRPPRAGVRILCLDGGGLRGVAELMSLRHLQKEFEWMIPICSFFDLIVGTSTGGFIALGLGEKGWDVEECLEKFEALTHAAFPAARKRIFGFDILNRLKGTAQQGRHKVEALEAALGDEFGTEECLFGGRRAQDDHQQSHRPKVAVSVTSANGIPCILTNYNRPEAGDTIPYDFLRAETAENEVKIWEAARICFATPKLVRAYNHRAKGQSFQDGSIYYNNPVEIGMSEFKLAFQDAFPPTLDLLLSLGTARGRGRLKRPLPVVPITPVTPISPQKALPAYYKQQLKIVTDHVQLSLHTENVWHDFLQRQPGNDDKDLRFKRLNFELPDPLPKPDDVNKFDEFKSAIDHALYERKAEIRAVADRLLATAFYFRQTRQWPSSDRQSMNVSGHIECRFAPGSQEIRGVGLVLMKRLQEQSNGSGNRRSSPCFVVMEKWRERYAKQIMFSHDLLSQMKLDGQFHMDLITFEISSPATKIDIHLRLPSELDNDYSNNNSISGFPRYWDWGSEATSPVKRPDFSKRRHAQSRRTVRPEWSMPSSSGPTGVMVSYARNTLPGLASSNDLERITQRLTRAESEAFRFSGLQSPTTPTWDEKRGQYHHHSKNAPLIPSTKASTRNFTASTVVQPPSPVPLSPHEIMSPAQHNTFPVNNVSGHSLQRQRTPAESNTNRHRIAHELDAGPVRRTAQIFPPHPVVMKPQHKGNDIDQYSLGWD